MVTIENIQQPTLRDGKPYSSGRVTLSNSIDVWFSEIHPIKTEQQATEIAKTIIQSLNK